MSHRPTPGGPKLLNGLEVAGYLQERHARQVRGMRVPPHLAIVRMGDDAATTRYLAAKQRYGSEIGVGVEVVDTTPSDILARIEGLNNDPAVTGIIVQLPLGNRALEAAALAAVSKDKDVDGLAPDSPFEVATPKAVIWLLAAYNIEPAGKVVAVVGQGRLVGAPLSGMLERAGATVVRIDVDTPDLAAALRPAAIVITATGRPGLITADMLAPGAVVIDCGAPASELADDARLRTDLTLSPVPGGVGPMTVAALFDNALIAGLKL